MNAQPAPKEEPDKHWKEYMALLPFLIEEQGISNVVGGLSEHVEKMNTDAEEGTPLQLDLEVAARHLEIAAGATDLIYNDNQKGRSFDLRNHHLVYFRDQGSRICSKLHTERRKGVRS